jgi:hypothetical protein
MIRKHLSLARYRRLFEGCLFVLKVSDVPFECAFNNWGEGGSVF